jgi:hypothetical protein
VAGQLFIGNPTVSEVSCWLNEESLRPLRPCYWGPPPPPYAPPSYSLYFLRVNRVTSPEPGLLGFGENTLRVCFESEPREKNLFVVNVKKTNLIGSDIVAFVFRGELLLLDPAGRPLGRQPIVPSNPAAASAAVDKHK